MEEVICDGPRPDARRGSFKRAKMLLVAGAAISLAGCGTNAGQEKTMSASNVTPDDVIRHFHAKTGTNLHRLKPVTALRELGRVDPLAPSDLLRKRFGNFRIGVFRDHDSIPKAIPQGKPGENDVFWERQYPLEEYAQPYWSAVKFYGNVQLIWWSDKRAVNDQWRALDRILTDLIGENSG